MRHIDPADIVRAMPQADRLRFCDWLDIFDGDQPGRSLLILGVGASWFVRMAGRMMRNLRQDAQELHWLRVCCEPNIEWDSTPKVGIFLGNPPRAVNETTWLHLAAESNLLIGARENHIPVGIESIQFDLPPPRVENV